MKYIIDSYQQLRKPKKHRRRQIKIEFGFLQKHNNNNNSNHSNSKNIEHNRINSKINQFYQRQ